MNAQLLNNTLVNMTIKSADLILGVRYQFPYSQIAWTYLGDRYFYSPEYDTYKRVARETLTCKAIR